jgi:hypothetical protein
MPPSSRALSRLLELDEGTVEPRFTLVHTPPETFPGARFFVCHHLTPELLRRPEWGVHANGTRRIGGLTAAVDDMPAIAAACGAVFGAEAVQADGDGFTVALGGGADLRLAATVPGQAPGLVAMTLVVDDPAATAACLEAAGVAHERRGDDLAVGPEMACGAGLVFTGG